MYVSLLPTPSGIKMIQYNDNNCNKKYKLVIKPNNEIRWTDKIRWTR